MAGSRSLDPGHFTVRQALELEACTRCGECMAWCPTYRAAQLETITPLSKITQFRAFWKGHSGGWLARLFGLGPPTEAAIAAFSEGVYGCTLCGRCAAVCPVRLRTRELWVGMREQLVDWEAYPAALGALRANVGASRNTSGEDNAQRLIWSENLETAPPLAESTPTVDTLYFVGCVASFYPAVYAVPQSFCGVLERAGVSFAVLGGEEWCCGFPLVTAGMGQNAHCLARHNVEAVRRSGARRLVTTCPSCYHTWQRTYPEMLGEPLGFEVLHATELLASLLDEGRLPLRRLEQVVTYHDPCDLGRNSGIYEAPRVVLQAIPGLRLAEMAETRQHALCCGGGGDVEMGAPALTEKVAHLRLEQARQTGAALIVTACQQCKRTLAAQARREKLRLRVADVVELVHQALE
ncbi:MAG: (Fe-S)-binding protein [Chloroflexi bacterium]|nr:(Fe-S)-binding protein [Chloroflexota bacterium]